MTLAGPINTAFLRKYKHGHARSSKLALNNSH
jgi:hypothetical protein